MSQSENTIALSLISHTNAGKTTLARTLLGRDVGEVRDEAHVTNEAARDTLIDTPQGDVLVLWDTPGFGDSARLARRLAGQSNPIGWFVSQIWDRFRDRPLYLSQQAVRNVRDEADIVLYLVDASEAPVDAGYLVPELDVLAWIGRPVFVLLNKTGPPRPRAEEEAEEKRWRDALGDRHFVRAVLTLDAFARCWVQEVVLLRVIAPAISPAKQASYARLIAAWQARRQAQFESAIAALAVPIARAARDHEILPSLGFKDTLRDLFRSIVSASTENEERQHAARALASRLDTGLRESTDRLISIYSLEGRAAAAVRAQMFEFLRTDEPLHEGKAAMLGGVLSGALSGLAADLAAGGLTLGAGTMFGALAGAAGGAGLARGFNVLRGTTQTELRWDEGLLDALVIAALLRYLAVTHFGRGRGEWKESADPPFWREVVQGAVEKRRTALASLWDRRTIAAESESMETQLRAILKDAAREVLATLYPGALEVGDVDP